MIAVSVYESRTIKSLLPVWSELLEPVALVSSKHKESIDLYSIRVTFLMLEEEVS